MEEGKESRGSNDTVVHSRLNALLFVRVRGMSRDSDDDNGWEVICLLNLSYLVGGPVSVPVVRVRREGRKRGEKGRERRGREEAGGRDVHDWHLAIHEDEVEGGTLIIRSIKAFNGIDSITGSHDLKK